MGGGGNAKFLRKETFKTNETAARGIRVFFFGNRDRFLPPRLGFFFANGPNYIPTALKYSTYEFLRRMLLGRVCAGWGGGT